MPLRRKQSKAVITAGMSKTEISCQPVAVLKLQLYQFHLPHGGNKHVVMKRFSDYMQKRQAQDV